MPSRRRGGANFQVQHKSKNFDRNLSAELMEKQIKKNMIKGDEILYQSANNIAPYDPLRKPASGPHLRQNTERQIRRGYIIRVWLAAYAVYRYVTNGKNPKTTYWIRRGYKRKKKVLDNIARNDVVK